MGYLKRILIILIVILSVKSFSAAEEVKVHIVNNTKYVLVSDYNILVRDFNSCRELIKENQKVIEDNNKTIYLLGKEISSQSDWKLYVGITIGALAGYGVCELLNKLK